MQSRSRPTTRRATAVARALAALTGVGLLVAVAVASREFVLAPWAFWGAVAAGVVLCGAAALLRPTGRRHLEVQAPDLVRVTGRLQQPDGEAPIAVALVAADRRNGALLDSIPLGAGEVAALADVLAPLGTVAMRSGEGALAIFECANPDEAAEVVAQLRLRLLQEFREDDRAIASAGWSVSPGNGNTLDELIQRADLALQTCRRERPGGTHRSSPTDAWIDHPDKVAEILGLLAHASVMRGADPNAHDVRAVIARQAAESLGYSPLYLTLVEGAGLIWDARLQEAEAKASPTAPARDTLLVRVSHMQQSIEMFEQYGALRRTPLTTLEERSHEDVVLELARVLAIIDDQQRMYAAGLDERTVHQALWEADLGEHDRRLVDAVCALGELNAWGARRTGVPSTQSAGAGI